MMDKMGKKAVEEEGLPVRLSAESRETDYGNV